MRYEPTLSQRSRIKGSLTSGKLADIVILDRDIMTIPEEQILDTLVLHTIVGGKVVYSAR